MVPKNRKYVWDGLDDACLLILPGVLVGYLVDTYYFLRWPDVLSDNLGFRYYFHVLFLYFTLAIPCLCWVSCGLRFRALAV